MGTVTEIATSAPGCSTLKPNNKAPLAETLKLNGYSTAQFGKCHEVPVFQNSPVGPFDMWPTGSGFEYFYGFIAGEDNQWYPSLYEGTTPVEVNKTPEQGYHLTEDLADHAINWLRTQKSIAPDKPFFIYFAPGATHAPHHVPKEWIDKYKGKFAHGWDKQREITFAKQKELGVIPADAELTTRHAEIPAWDEMPAALKPVLERQMETYAGFMSHTDHHIGRIIDAIEQLGVMDNTLIYVITGDNGASGEGTLKGTFNEMMVFNGMADILETPEYLAARLEQVGRPRGDAPLRGRLGLGDGHAVSVDQAGGLALGRHAQRHHRALAQGYPRKGRAALPVQPCHRRRAHRARGRRHSRADPDARRDAKPVRRDEHGL